MPPKPPSLAELKEQAALVKAELARKRALLLSTQKASSARFKAAQLGAMTAITECCARVADIEAYLMDVDAWIDWATPRIKAAAGPGSGDEPKDPKFPPP